jgi:hypothetical protein
VGFQSPSVSNEFRGRGGGVTSFQWGSDGSRAALRFGSPHMEEGVTSGGARHGNVGRAGGGGSGVRLGTTREMVQMGRFTRMGRLGNWAGEGFQAKIKNLNRWASDLIFEFISWILSLKSKVSNISNWIVELRSN